MPAALDDPACLQPSKCDRVRTVLTGGRSQGVRSAVIKLQGALDRRLGFVARPAAVASIEDQHGKIFTMALARAMR